MTDKAITQEEVNNAAWAACDTLRSVMDASQYKDYILVMLFLKYISDIWNHNYEKYKKEYKDKDRIRRQLKRDPFLLPDGHSFKDLYEQRNAHNIGKLINNTLAAIEKANKPELNDIITTTDFNSENNLGKPKDRNRRLKTLLEDFNNPKLDMRPSRVSSDVIGNTYIYLIERFASDAGRQAGEFYTPSAVSLLVAKLCAPKPGAKICDPACGSGSLLLKAAQEVGNDAYRLYGMESNGKTWGLCRMNMFLHGVESAQIEWCNSLTSPALLDDPNNLMKFDNIVANPPYSLKWGAEEAEADPFNRFWRGVPPKSKADYAFISHMVEAAVEKSGRVAVVVPHGVLFRGAAEGRIRQKFIEDNLLDAVIGLPGNLFPTTSIPVAILVFDRAREAGGKNHSRKDVLFIDASRDYKSETNQNTLEDEHLKKILDTYKKRKTKDKYSYSASYSEIQKNDFNLNIPRYVDTFEEEVEIDIDEVQKEIDKLEKQLTEVRAEIAAQLKTIKR